MLTIFLRFLGVLLAAMASVPAFFASIARIDSFAELKYIMQLDVFIGFVFAMAFLLWRIPHSAERRAKKRLITALGLVLIWATISGGLLWSHEEQVRLRSGHQTILWPWRF